MACIQYPRKERAGVSLGSWEKPTIYKEPLKEVFTKKKERVEEGDVTYNIRNDPSQYNDAISNYQKGSNMMVEVDYQNRAPQTTTMNFGSASNPYKVNKSFRPPEFNLLDLQPLSRQKRPYIQGGTNIGSSITRNDLQEGRNDRTEVSFSIGMQPLYQANTNLSNEQGIYRDNFERKDMINEEYVTKQVISQLKGLESNELQKMFQYENTPNGIILTPLQFSGESAYSGPISVEQQRHLSEQVYATDSNKLAFGVNSNHVGRKEYEMQRHLSELQYSTENPINMSVQSTMKGVQSYDGQLQINKNDYTQDALNMNVQTNQKGSISYQGHHSILEQDFTHNGFYLNVESNRKGIQSLQGEYNQENGTRDSFNIGVESNRKGLHSLQGEYNQDDGTRDAFNIGVESNRKGLHYQHSVHLDENNYTYDRQHMNVQANKKGLQQQVLVQYQEQMKDILLKNMKSSVSIVIQQYGSEREIKVDGHIKDKIDIVVHSTKGQPIFISRENGEPIKLKEYTWKFIKSASGSDKFVIMMDSVPIELDRKGELYSLYSNPGNNVIQPEAEDVQLRRQATNISVSANKGVAEDINRFDESVSVNRVEKQTHYTDHQVQANSNGMERSSWSSIKPSDTHKKKNIQNMILTQSVGRF